MAVLSPSGKIMIGLMCGLSFPIFMIYSYRDGWFNIFGVIYRLLCKKKRTEEKVAPYDPETRGIASNLVANKLAREAGRMEENHPLGPQKKRKHKNPTRG
jgi:hypothetical protein